MPVLGVLLCESLELEFAWLLARAHGISGITVLEDERSQRFIRALETDGRHDVARVPHIASFRPVSPDDTEVLVRVLELSLHGRKEILRHALEAAAAEFAVRVDALLLGYGSCGGALDDPAGTLDVAVPVFLPEDHGKPADDCVSICLGGRHRYYAEQRKVPGTFFMTPEWTCHWRKMFRKDCFGNAGAALLRRIFAPYERSLLVVTPVVTEDVMERNAEEFNRLFGLRTEVCKGTLSMLSIALRSALRCLKEKQCR